MEIISYDDSTPILFLISSVFSFAFGQQSHNARKIADGWQPAFSPDGKSIAVVQGGHLNILNVHGELIRKIGSGNWDAEPAWSPDGRKIAFASYGPKRLHSRDFAIWIVNIEGTDLHRLAERAKPNGDQYPSWSPEGTNITWTHGNRLWIADSSGKNARPLTNPSGSNSSGFWEHNATWSPNNKTIAFLRREHYESDGELWLVDADGKNERPLGHGIHAAYLKWSKDRRLLFYSDRQAVGKINIDDLNSSFCYAFEFGDVGVRWFSLSPDHRYVVYDTSAPEVNAEVMIARFVCIVK